MTTIDLRKTHRNKKFQWAMQEISEINDVYLDETLHNNIF